MLFTAPITFSVGRFCALAEKDKTTMEMRNKNLRNMVIEILIKVYF